LIEFIKDLPKNLAIEVSLFIHEGTYRKIDFLKNNSSESFLAWICPLLKPEILSSQDYVYFEGDSVTCMYFMKHGECGFVLPRHSNIKYIEIKPGNFFGIIDIVGSMLSIEAEDFDNWCHYKEKLKRQFTIQTQEKTELMSLNLDDLNNMSKEFTESYEDLLNCAYTRLNRAHKIKLLAIKYCNQNAEKFQIDEDEGIKHQGVKTGLK
jgi:CRP-like cAMP-binding protein